MVNLELCFKTACEQAQLIRNKKISVTQLITAHLDQIERLNPTLNAIVTLTAESALEEAQAADAALAKQAPLGALHGLPVAHKDLFLTKGVRTTFGSPIYQDFIPEHDSLPVERLKKAGAISLGKTNTPEFALDTPGSIFNAPLGRQFKGTKVAYSEDLGGLPVEPEVRQVMRAARSVFEQLGCEVIDDSIDLAEAGEIFMLWRAWRTELRISPLMKEHRHQLKDTVIWNAEQGLDLTGPQLARAEAKRTEIYHRMRAFMQRYQFFILPVNQVVPFSVDLDYPREIAGVKMETYIDWQKTAYFISAMGNPAISVPAGFTDSGLPVGIQIVGGHRQDFEVLQMAYAFEQATRFGERRPPICLN
ncbi:MAG: hypothetical protein EB139_01690 [Burkholderiaceae bacterium]|nr:hypothetical protein [Burkholderiaceae bacterium]